MLKLLLKLRSCWTISKGQRFPMSLVWTATMGMESGRRATATIWWSAAQMQEPPQAACHAHMYFSWRGGGPQRHGDLGLWVLCSFETLSQTCGALNPKTLSRETRSLWNPPPDCPSCQAGLWTLPFSVRMLLLQLKPTQTPGPRYCLCYPSKISDIWDRMGSQRMWRIWWLNIEFIIPVLPFKPM